MLSHVDTVNDRDLVVYNVQLAAHEVCTNIVNHAYEEIEQGRIDIKLVLHFQPAQLVIEFQDTGRPFDVTTVPEPNLEEPQVHGYGMFLIKNLMDSVTYTPQSDGNRWQLIKHL
ncbi:MAG: ATP-binding protein [Chloroflexaceae bacterium]|jgi:serine/threonine-protein kinase RsbW|nr:ATP-binding protein [Chloroflexaceae bacterium]